MKGQVRVYQSIHNSSRAVHNFSLFIKNTPHFVRMILIFLFSIFVCFWHISFAQDEDFIPDVISNAAINDIDEEPQNEEQARQQALQQNQNQEIQPKILKLDILTDISSLANQTLYVGQYINISYRVMLFDDARIVYTEFNPPLEQTNASNKQESLQSSSSVALVKDSGWEKTGEYWNIHYTFKILKPEAIVPSLVVHVQNNHIQDAMQTDTIDLQAQSLSSNPLYCNVVASNLKVIDYTLEEYDENNNMILIEIEGQNSNLEDFYLKNIKEQEFGQGTKFSSDIARVNILALVPKSLESIDFNYFNIGKKEFENISIPNSINVIPADEYVKEGLNPKNSFLGVANLAIISLLIVLVLLTLINRSYFFAALSVLLLGILAYRFFSNTYTIKTLPNAKVLILPTHNSTELLIIANPAKLKAIDKKNGFYKVNINSTKVGWINKSQIK